MPQDGARREVWEGVYVLMEQAPREFIVYILLRGGQYVPLRIDKTLLENTLNLFVTMLNDRMNPQHRIFQAKSARGLPTVILMEEVAAFYVAPFTLSAQDRIAKVLEKHVDTGEEWKPDE